MLLEFRLRNYRSFAQEATLSLVASTDKSLQETNTAATGIRALKRSVRAAVVYGANASGKSNLLRGMLMMSAIVRKSFALKPEQHYAVQPFRLNEATRKQPTLFEATFIIEGIRYQYGFELTPQRIIGEWLLVYRSAKPQRWIDRRFDSETNEETYEFSDNLTGHKRDWQAQTRPNALFLSTAVQLNSEQLKPLHQWLTNSLVVLLDGGMLDFTFSTNLVQTPEGMQDVRSVLGAADIAISSIAAVRQKGFASQFRLDLATGRAETLSQPERFSFRNSGIRVRTLRQTSLLMRNRRVRKNCSRSQPPCSISSGTARRLSLTNWIAAFIRFSFGRSSRPSKIQISTRQAPSSSSQRMTLRCSTPSCCAATRSGSAKSAQTSHPS